MCERNTEVQGPVEDNLSAILDLAVLISLYHVLGPHHPLKGYALPCFVSPQGWLPLLWEFLWVSEL